MALHLLKLSVGIVSVDDLAQRGAQRVAARLASGGAAEIIHTTRMVPKRSAELLDGGSIFWVIRGQIAARQEILDLRPFTDGEGIGRCDIVLKPGPIPVLPLPCRPFQGWRYLSEDKRPADLAASADLREMPERLRCELRELCLI